MDVDKGFVLRTDASLQSWHKEHVDTPSGPAARRARWHETFAKFDLSVVYVTGKNNTVANCLSRRAHPACKAWMDISSHGVAEETEEAKSIIELQKAMEEGDTKCFVVMASKMELSQGRNARVRVSMEDTLEECLMAPIEYVGLVLMDDLLQDYTASEHCNKYWNIVSAPSDDERPEGLTEDGVLGACKQDNKKGQPTKPHLFSVCCIPIAGLLRLENREPKARTKRKANTGHTPHALTCLDMPLSRITWWLIAWESKALANTYCHVH